ncbi:MAG: hypothetical protein WAW80_02850 [Candidatus Saccharimonadales bacterium]
MKARFFGIYTRIMDVLYAVVLFFQGAIGGIQLQDKANKKEK